MKPYKRVRTVEMAIKLWPYPSCMQVHQRKAEATAMVASALRGEYLGVRKVDKLKML